MKKDESTAPQTASPPTEDRTRELGSFRVTTIFGIPVRIHGMFSILMLVLGGLGTASGNFELALFLPAVLLVTVIHELGHTLAARRLGYPVRSIVLHPFRGPTLAQHPERPQDETWIALAGPAANLLAAMLILGIFYVSGKPPFSSGGGLTSLLQGNLLGRFVFFNIFVAVLNLVPVFPLDGGHVLRGILAAAGIPRAKATRAVVIVSYSTAALCVAGSVLQASVYGMLFAVMVTLGTTQMMGNDSFFSAIKGLKVKDVMQQEVQTLLLAQTLNSTVKSDLRAAQRFFPVTCGDEVFGILSRFSIESGLRNGKGSAYVAELMNRQMIFVDPDEPLQNALERSRLSPGMPILVGEQGNFLGMITQESIRKRLSEERSVLHAGAAVK